MQGFNVVIRVLEKEVVMDRDDGSGNNLKLEECIVGDETGKMILTARNGTYFAYSQVSTNCVERS